LPAVIIGAVVVVAGLVTMLLTTRNLPDTRTSVTADALPTGHPTLDPVAAMDATTLPAAHGSLDPNGPAVDVMSIADARTHLDAGTAVFVDVRTGSDYAVGHIPGALTITSQELNARIDALPEGSVIIAYGDSTRPESGQRGAQIFMDLGYPKVIALEGGFQDWQNAGNPVEK
ncbi:MAG: rhodanese-like domain-containing protein, partial [Oscillochloris sp.]|nr:rhodanese-like domain-containing protein [Oscillochloris sp.]